ncbi:MAG: hypothetical protein ACJAVI_002985 [Candidatus Azotimanducaceae bacterium]|jgi:hypothetical protein
MRWLFIIALLVTSSAVAGVTQWLPFQIDNGHITIPVKVHGQAGRAMLDSGAGINGINSLFVIANEDKFTPGGKVEIEGVFGRAHRSTYNKVPVELYGVDVEIDNMVEMRNFDSLVLLGRAFFQTMVMQIDYPNKRLRMIDHDSINLKKLKNIDMRINRKLGMPIVKTRLNDEKNIWVLLDTGSTGGLIIERFLAKSAGWLDKYQVEKGAVRGVAETNATDNFQLPEVQFGPFGIENVLTTVVADGEVMKPLSKATSVTGSHIRSKSVKGIVGYEVLKHFVLTVDYKHGRMHVGLPEDPTAN